ncbi:MAG: hypothetical protein WCV90_08900 [Candidatus Woesearchaeota archaeon]|jgi:hypothetical protein
MLVYGIDIPLIEVVLALSIILFLLLVEAIVVISLMIKQLNKTKSLADLVEKMTEALLAIKKAEIEELDKLRGRR